MPSPITLKDQTGRLVNLEKAAKRIVSLVPSQTELLYDLGLNEEVIGQTLFCIHPNWAHQSKKRVGGTKTAKLDLIKSLKPDLILANKEENVKEQIEELEKDFPVYVSDIATLEDSLKMIEDVGILVDKTPQANQLISDIQQSFSRLISKKSAGKVVYLIWKEPLMAAGKGTFIDAMLAKCGFENAIDNSFSRYPELAIEQVNKMSPDWIFCSSEPFPFNQKHLEDLTTMGLNGKKVLVDGELFSWYGSRLIHAPHYFETLLKQLND